MAGPLTINEIPREGDLKDAPQATREELINLRTEVQRVTASEVEGHRDLFDAAIRSGSRAEVVRALQTLQTRGEFSSLRDRIEAARISVSDNGFGLADQAIVRGEQGARYVYQNILPNWAKIGVLGAALGGATSLALLPVQWFTRFILRNPAAAESISKFRSSAFTYSATAGLVLGAGKGVMDVVNSRTGTGNALLRQLPGGPMMPGTPTVDLGERASRVEKTMAAMTWARDTNTITLPPLPTDLNISFMELVPVAGDDTRTAVPVRFGTTSDQSLPLHTSITRVIFRYKVTGDDTMKTIEKSRP
ncbi:MAG TPA: hypothetical protein PKV72_03750 [Candidatus Peribacteria bacterium]|nr:hypothetical protein [Candidatus Peribacteria bacterium]